MLHETIELMKVDSRKHLARDVADGDAAFRQYSLSLSLSLDSRCVQICGAVTCDHIAEEIQHTFVFDASLEQLDQYLVGNAVEERSSISTPEPAITIPPQKLLSAVDGTMQSFALATRPNIVLEAPVEDLNEFVVKKTMDETIAERCYSNSSSFVIADDERAVRTMTIETAREIGSESAKVLFETVTEPLELRRAFFASLETKPTVPQGFQA